MKTSEAIIFNFNKDSDIVSWRIVNDAVMGGNSVGSFVINDKGNGEYSGEISLENNGGFSSLRYRFDKKNIQDYTKVVFKIKGDGKSYQFRIKKDVNDAHSYVSSFVTSGEWQTVEIELSTMYPAFRGRTLDMQNLSSKYIEEIAFLIGNKKEENFKLLIDKIYLHK